MSCFTVQVLEPSGKIIEVETCAGEIVSSVTLENRSAPNIELNSCVAQLPSDFEERIFAVVSGDIIASTGISSSVSGNKLYLHSLLNSGSGISLSHNSGIYTISSTGLALSNHQHVSNDIINFNSSVSGLLPVKNILGGSGIDITSLSGNYTVSVTGTFGLTSEEVDDRVNSLLKSGSYIDLNYNDNLNELTISVSGLQPVGNYALIYTGDPTSIGAENSWVDRSFSLWNDAAGSLGLMINDETIYLGQYFGSDADIRKAFRDVLQLGSAALSNSGDFAQSIHNHLSTDISDFNSAVSGLIPPSNFTSLTGLSGITVSNSGTDYYVSLNDPTIQLGDITDLSSNAQTFLLSSSSDNLRSLLTDETGSGSLVFNFSPSFSGIPTVPTAVSGTNSNQIASTAFVRTEISNLVDSSPSTLDTLNELAAALGDDPNFATTLTNSLAGKVNKSGDTMTGSLYAPSGLFDYYLSVNGTPVSISGHNHIASDITNFNTSVSGLLPTINNSGDNRLLTSTGSDVGINAENNLTFDGSLLNVIGSGSFNSGISITNLGGSFSMPANTGSILFNNSSGNVFFIGDGTGGANIISKYSNNTTPAQLFFRKYRGSYSSPTVINSGDNIGFLRFDSILTDNTLVGMASMVVRSESAPASGATNIPASMIFNVASSDSPNTSPTERMRINSNGFVGINKSSPVYSLDVNGTGSFASGLFVQGLLTASSGNLSNLILGSIQPSSNYIEVYKTNTKSIDYYINQNTTNNTTVYQLFTIPNNRVWQYYLKLNCLNITTSETAYFNIKGCIKNINNTINTVGSQMSETWRDNGMDNVSCILDNDGGLSLKIKGLISNNLSWNGVLTVVELVLP